MSSTYASTVLQDAIYTAMKKDTFQSFETRGSVYGALDIATAQTNILLPKSTIQKIKQAESQAEKINVFKKESEGTDVAFACSFSGNGATDRMTLTYEPFVEGFSLSYGDMSANMYTYAEMYQMRFEEKMKSMYKRIDEYVVSILEANYSAGAGDSFTLYNNAFQVPLDEYDLSAQRSALWLNKLKSDIRKNDFSGDNIHVLGDSNLVSVMSAMINQGTGTQTNLGFQFQGVTSNFTNRIVNNNGIYATGFVFEQGAFGIIDWIDPLFRAGKEIGTDEWTSFIEPRYGMTIGVKVKRECADNTSVISGMTMSADFQESWQFGVMVAVPIAYSSDANTFIYKYELDADNNVLSGSGSY